MSCFSRSSVLVTLLLLWRDTIMKATDKREVVLGLMRSEGGVHYHPSRKHGSGQTGTMPTTAVAENLHPDLQAQGRWRAN